MTVKWFRYRAKSLVLGLCYLLLALSVAAGGPKAAPNTPEEEPSSQKLYQRSFALVVGIDNYTNGWPKLENGVKDAKLVGEALSKAGYEVQTLFDADSKTLQATLRQFFIEKGKYVDGRLLLWYAGHGQTLNEEGFIVPADAPATSDASFKLSAIHMRDFGGWVRLAESKHVLAVFDSCFAGTIFNTDRGAPPASIARAVNLPVRQFITSGEANQSVLDNGLFRDLFIKSVSGSEDADLNGDGFLTGSEFGYFISDRVTNLTDAFQTPRYGKLADRHFDQGEFVLAILSKQKEIVDTAVQLQTTQDDSALWQEVSAMGTVAAYQVYLKRFPKGIFADLAYLKIVELNGGGQPDSKQDSRAKPSLAITKSIPQPVAPVVVTSPAPEVKSISELMNAARERQGAVGTAVNRLAHGGNSCVASCERIRYSRIGDTQQDQTAEERCTMATSDDASYRGCYQNALKQWTAGKVAECKSRC